MLLEVFLGLMGEASVGGVVYFLLMVVITGAVLCTRVRNMVG